MEVMRPSIQPHEGSKAVACKKKMDASTTTHNIQNYIQKALVQFKALSHILDKAFL